MFSSVYTHDSWLNHASHMHNSNLDIIHTHSLKSDQVVKRKPYPATKPIISWGYYKYEVFIYLWDNIILS